MVTWLGLAIDSTGGPIMRDPHRRHRFRGTSFVVVVAAMLLAACGSTSRDDPTLSAKKPSGGIDSTTTSVPGPVTGYSFTTTPPGLKQIRSYSLATPTGGTAQIRWFSASGDAPTMTSNLTTGEGVGTTALAATKSRADEIQRESAQAGAPVTAPREVAIGGKQGIAYSDGLGWRSLGWVVDDNAVMAITALHVDDATIISIARGVTFQ